MRALSDFIRRLEAFDGGYALGAEHGYQRGALEFFDDQDSAVDQLIALIEADAEN